MLTKEEEKFGKTIDQGLDILNGMEEEMKGKGGKSFFRSKCIYAV